MFYLEFEMIAFIFLREFLRFLIFPLVLAFPFRSYSTLGASLIKLLAILFHFKRYSFHYGFLCSAKLYESLNREYHPKFLLLRSVRNRLSKLYPLLARLLPRGHVQNLVNWWNIVQVLLTALYSYSMSQHLKVSKERLDSSCIKGKKKLN